MFYFPLSFDLSIIGFKGMLWFLKVMSGKVIECLELETLAVFTIQQFNKENDI